MDVLHRGHVLCRPVRLCLVLAGLQTPRRQMADPRRARRTGQGHRRRTTGPRSRDADQTVAGQTAQGPADHPVLRDLLLHPANHLRRDVLAAEHHQEDG
ncbi:hypothetical protein D3C87_1991170 [compost metagenome]